ncbi:MAG: hypothetical protein FJ104_06925 [Deltaproteobacteria bacterium]|nr:hypothetical protein [Deltaproteobacteria bacterium]
MKSKTALLHLPLLVLPLAALGCGSEDPSSEGSAQAALGAGLLPDLRSVIPLQVQLVNKQQTEKLRFSNGVANVGAGTLQLRPGDVNAGGARQEAVQQLLDADGNVTEEVVVSNYDYHPSHKHFHIDAVAEYSVYAGSPTGVLVAEKSRKVTYCLVDWYKLESNSPDNQRRFSDCSAGTQGISPGWVDQYHHSLPDQDLDITGLPAGTYYLVTVANPTGVFLESDLTNNTAWVSFELTRDSSGNPKLRVTGNSPCDTPGLCGVGAPNR